MKETIRRLVITHLAVLVVVAFGSALGWGASASLAAFVGALAFSLPVVVFGVLVTRASTQDSSKFWGRFMLAEALKWVLATALLAAAFALGLFLPLPLLGGFIFSVLAQIFFPIFVPKASES